MKKGGIAISDINTKTGNSAYILKIIEKTNSFSHDEYVVSLMMNNESLAEIPSKPGTRKATIATTTTISSTVLFVFRDLHICERILSET